MPPLTPHLSLQQVLGWELLAGDMGYVRHIAVQRTGALRRGTAAFVAWFAESVATQKNIRQPRNDAARTADSGRRNRLHKFQGLPF